MLCAMKAPAKARSVLFFLFFFLHPLILGCFNCVTLRLSLARRTSRETTLRPWPSPGATATLHSQAPLDRCIRGSLFACQFRVSATSLAIVQCRYTCFHSINYFLYSFLVLLHLFISLVLLLLLVFLHSFQFIGRISIHWSVYS